MPFCNHLASHRRNLRANEMLEGDSSDATAAADARKGAVVEDEEFVDEELDDFSTEKLV